MTNYRNELTDIFEQLSQNLDITETQFKAAIRSYQAIQAWLTDPDSPLYDYQVVIYPQGSLLLGTIIQAINDEDDLDIDLVCKLEKKPNFWTQKNTKDSVGNRLKEHSTYAKMIEDLAGGRRCWTLRYAEDSNFHMDILPAVANEQFATALETRFFSNTALLGDLAIRITDKNEEGYAIDPIVLNWLKSNPFGYAQWFYQRGMTDTTLQINIKELIDPEREFRKEKSILQRIVQLLKRHRDVMFLNDSLDSEDKPISIIITTLAARAYNRETNFLDALQNVVRNMRSHIEERFNFEEQRLEKWVVNPVNEEENFADKWAEKKQKERYFIQWLDKLEDDVRLLSSGDIRGIYNLQQKFADVFGDRIATKAFASYGEINRKKRDEGKRRMAERTGMLGATGIPVRSHNFEGNGEEIL